MYPFLKTIEAEMSINANAIEIYPEMNNVLLGYF
jgi:hypothetical protein